MLPDDAPVDSDAGPPTSSTPSAHSDGSTRPRGASRGFRKIMMYRWSIGFGNTPAAHGSRLAMSLLATLFIVSRRASASRTWMLKRLSQTDGNNFFSVYYTVSSSRRSCSARRGLDHEGPYVYVMSTLHQPATRPQRSTFASGDASDGQRALAGGSESLLLHAPARCHGAVRSNRANARSLSVTRPGRAHDDRALRPTCKIPHTPALTVSCVIDSRVPQLNG